MKFDIGEMVAVYDPPLAVWQGAGIDYDSGMKVVRYEDESLCLVTAKSRTGHRIRLALEEELLVPKGNVYG